MRDHVVPLIIDGKDVVLEVKEGDTDYTFVPNPDALETRSWRAQGVSPELCLDAVKSCAKAFTTWKTSTALERQRLFLTLAEVLKQREEELKTIIQTEIFCSPLWATINYNETVSFVNHAAALCTSGVLNAEVPEVERKGAHAVVYRVPLGVILGIAPWNSPAILALRSVLAPVAAGNCAILKGSELSPRTHYFIADAFRQAGFPAGVVNFLLHRPQDAAQTFEALISQPAVRKCNFTGSTQVGKIIAAKAASHLKPVLMELGGKNFVIVLGDANLERAADAILEGALLNNGQICMSTDLVLVDESKKRSLCELLKQRLPCGSVHFERVISSRSNDKILSLVKDAEAKGAKCHSVTGQPDGQCEITLLEDVTTDMRFWREESFGPLLGVTTIKDAQEAIGIINSCSYGLSAGIWTKTSLTSLALARSLDVGAIHINGVTVHDEASLPHGGYKDSGWGRFGSKWGLGEFIQIQTIVMNPE